MKFTARIQQYLKNKLKGGEINERGNKYESYFATYKIIQLVNIFPAQTKSIFLSSQETAFVDDLLILVDQERELFQLKSSAKLNWGRGKILKTLNFDFSIQRRIELFYKRNFKLFLTVCNLPLQTALNKSLPRHLKGCTKVLLFPFNDSIQNQILNDKDFRDELTRLSAFSAPTVDKLECLATTILGVWDSSNKKSICLEDLLSKVEKIAYSFIKNRNPQNIKAHTKSILDAIPDFHYVIHGNYLTWKYKDTDSGTILYPVGSKEFNDIEQKISNENPKNFITLEKFIY